jgi:hypothetical protein
MSSKNSNIFLEVIGEPTCCVLIAALLREPFHRKLLSIPEELSV